MTPYSKLREQPRIDLATASPLAGPLTLYCEMTNRCNLRCGFCPESHPDYARIAGGIKMLSADDLIRVRDCVEELGGVKSLYLHSLGEPMLNPHSAFFVKMMRPHAEKICVTTNGTVPLVKLLDAPPDYVRVSVYGLSQEEFEATTNSKVDHRRVRENVRELWRARQERNQKLPFIYVKGNSKFSAIHYVFHNICDEVDVEPTMNWNGQGEWGGTDYGENKKACPAPFYMLNIHADMRVSVCGVDWSKRLVVGNLREQSLLDIWRSDAADQIRLSNLRGERKCIDGCKDCTYYRTTLPDNLDSLTAEEYERRKELSCVSA